jgi:membrane fusion protein (multidrug efflux system)
LIRRHFFLAGALVVLVLVIVAGGLRIIMTPHGPAGAGGPASAQNAGGPPGGGGPGGRGGGRGGPGGRGAPMVTPAVATLRDFEDRIDVLGVAKGRRSVTLSSATQQIATRVLFRDGQFVRQGQVLVDLQAGAEEAGIASARARLFQAQRDYQRWSELARRGVAPRATADQYQAAYLTAQADLGTAQARRQDRTVRAPFSGRVGLSDIAPGALLNPGSPIVTLDDVSSIRVDFQVPDRYLPYVRAGAQINARADAYPDRTFIGSIALLDSRVDERTRSITARAEFPNPTGQLLPGMLMRVAVVQGRRQSVAVPEQAVQFEGDRAFVFVLQPGERGLQVHRQPVVVGVNQDGQFEIRSGLAPGARVAADGLNRLQDGQPVMLVGQGGPGGRGGPGSSGARRDGGPGARGGPGGPPASGASAAGPRSGGQAAGAASPAPRGPG